MNLYGKQVCSALYQICFPAWSENNQGRLSHWVVINKGDTWYSGARYKAFFSLFCRLGGMVNFTIPSTTSEMIVISTSQTFRSWVVIFLLRRPMACLSLNLYDAPGLVPCMNVLFWGPGDFPVSYSNRDTLWNAWNRHSGSFMVDTGILFSNMK